MVIRFYRFYLRSTIRWCLAILTDCSLARTFASGREQPVTKGSSRSKAVTNALPRSIQRATVVRKISQI